MPGSDSATASPRDRRIREIEELGEKLVAKLDAQDKDLSEAGRMFEALKLPKPERSDA